MQSIVSVTVDGDVIAPSANYALRGAELIVATTVAAPGDSVESLIKIKYTTGYGTADNVPEQLQLACKMLALHYFTGRGATSPQGIYHQVIPLGVETILAPYIVLEI